jgi:hypothetical protein
LTGLVRSVVVTVGPPVGLNQGHGDEEKRLGDMLRPYVGKKVRISVYGVAPRPGVRGAWAFIYLESHGRFVGAYMGGDGDSTEPLP